jgi:hypothetical protein
VRHFSKCLRCDFAHLIGLGFIHCSYILREEHRLRVFENRVLRRIFGPMREEVSGGRRRLHNEELHNLYSSPNVVRVIR